jgi:lysophospholipase L1-like esterase
MRVGRSSRLLPALAALALAIVVGATAGPAGARGKQALPRVTVIGDSVASSVGFDRDALAILAQGIDLQLQLAPCRRVGQSSCPYDGSRPPTVIQLVPTLGQALGSTVIIAVGYNDFESAYAGDIEDALTALRQAGVTRVLWATMREERDQYQSMNDDIRAAAARHPEMTVVDWNLYSRSHPDWFQPDGLHLQAAGAEAMATLFHKSLVGLGIPVAPPAAKLIIPREVLPVGTVGRAYAARLVARGGAQPYRWSRALGTLPAGLRLERGGQIRGTPRAVGTFGVIVRATDARGSSTTRRFILRVRPG